MRKYSVWLLSITVTLLLIATTTSALAQDGEQVVITAPAEGQSISGIFQVTGIIDFPDFLKYEIFIRTGGNNMSQLATVYAPVVNGILANLDTRAYADGTYQLVIRTVRPDSNYNEITGPSFTIANGQGAPAPGGPEVQPSPLYTPVSGALLRIQNCSGKDLEFDYTSPQGFCSADNLWIMAKAQDENLCVTVDALVIGGCEYRGTAWGSGESRARTYSFIADGGKIYELTYAGGTDLFINEVPGDDRAEGDTGNLGPGASAQAETPPPATDAILPVSGAAPSDLTYVMVGSGLLLLMIFGGVLASRREKRML